MAEFSEEEPRRPRTNRAAEYHRTAFADEKLDKSAAVTVPRKKGKKEKPAKNTSTRGLAVLALLEVIAIIGVLLWWLGWGL